MYAFHHSPKKIGAAGASCTPTRQSGAAVFKTARSTVPRTAAEIGRGGRSRTGTGNHAQRVLSPPCLRSNHAAKNWCGQRESHPHELSLTGSSGRRVYCFATSAKSWSIHRDVRPAVCLTKTVRRFLRVGCKNGRSGRTRTFVARRDNAFTARRNCCSATLRKNGGSSGIRTRGLLLMRELR